MPKDIEPTIVMTVRELGTAPTKVRETGIAVITVPEFRWGRCDIKSIALLPSVLAYQAARKAGANDAIFVGDNGIVNESTAGNIFIVTGGRLRTPPKGTRILPGVTRDKLLEAARSAGVDIAEAQITRPELYAAEEMFLTSTTAEVVPVVTVDGKSIGVGKTGPISTRVYEQFARMFIRK
jgi:D-alanine transaminase